MESMVAFFDDFFGFLACASGKVVLPEGTTLPEGLEYLHLEEGTPSNVISD